MARLEPLQKARPDREFANLQEAIGTNDIKPYFQFIDAKAQLYPNTFILNQLQRDASGKIKLGLDLQGGTSFLVEMDTSKLETTETGRTLRARLKPSPTFPMSPARCRRRWKSCANAWMPLAWPSRSSRPPAATHFDSVARLVGGRQGTRQGRKSKRRRTWNSGW